MTDSPEPLEDRLERLADATQNLRARSDFKRAVMLRVRGLPGTGGWMESVAALAKRGLLMAALATAAALLWAAQSDRVASETSAAVYAAVELGW